LIFIESEVLEYDSLLQNISKSRQECKKLQTIPGVGLITSVSFFAYIGDGSQFKNGRELSSWLGLVPRQYSSGGKQNLGRISKVGNRVLRSLMVHCARSLSSSIKRNCSNFSNNNVYLSGWLKTLQERKHANVATIAMANKLARIVWAVSNDKSEDASYKALSVELS
jgi:transposase